MSTAWKFIVCGTPTIAGTATKQNVPIAGLLLTVLCVNTGTPGFNPALQVDVMVIARYKFVFEAETVKQTLSPVHALMRAGPAKSVGMLMVCISGLANAVGVIPQSRMTKTIFS